MYSRLEQLLKEHNISAYRLAKETKINTATFSEWKKGTYVPKADKLQKIADYFNVSISWLLGTTDNRLNDNNSDKQPTQSPEIARLVKAAEKLSPEQIELVTAMINGMNRKQ